MEKEGHEEINLKKEKKEREAQDKRGKMTRRGRVKINRRKRRIGREPGTKFENVVYYTEKWEDGQ